MRAWILLGLCLAGCQGKIGVPVLGAGGADTVPDAPAPGAPTSNPGDPPSVPELPAAGTCGGQVLGRSYVSVFGQPREADRVDLGLGFERDMPVINTRWYQMEIENRLYEVLESYPHGELFRPEGVTGTFNGVRPPHTFARINQGPLTSVKLFEISFNICLAEVASRRSYSLWDHDRYLSAPTEQSATEFCTRVLSNAERQSPSADDLASCVEYATVDVAEDPVPARQWAYLCGMIGATTMSWTR